jgi:hypothetical protein
MSDDDLIRRGDALAALKIADTERCGKCGLPRDSHFARHPFVTTGFSDPAANIRALPAVQPAPVTVDEAEIARLREALRQVATLPYESLIWRDVARAALGASHE